MTSTRSEKRMKPVRLTTPNDRSLLAFKCWLREERQALRTKLPHFVGALSAPAGGPSLNPFEQRYLNMQVDCLIDGSELLMRSYLRHLLPAALEHPDFQGLFHLFARTTVELEAHKEASRSSRPRRMWQLDGEWHPARTTAVECVVGTLVPLANGPNSLANTAARPNNGLPRTQTGIATDHIRDACHRFAADNRHICDPSPVDPTFERLTAVLMRLGWEETVADVVWEKVTAESSPKPVTREFTRRLHAAGRILDWLTAAEAETRLPVINQVRNASSVMLLQRLRHFKGELKKRKRMDTVGTRP